MNRPDAPSDNPLLHVVHEGSSSRGFESLRLVSARGPIHARLHAVPSPRGVVFVGGVGGDWDSPAHGLYSRLCADLTGDGTACLRLRFRDPAQLPEAEYDIIAAVEYLERRQVKAIALVGHSLGAAAAIRAASRCAAVRTVVALAAQSYGADGIGLLGPRCSILLIHGLSDRTLTPNCSVQLHAAAKEPKRLLLLPDAGHGLDEAAERVLREVRDWTASSLRAAEPEAGIRPARS